MISHRLRLEENNLGIKYAEECVPIRGLRTDLQILIGLSDLRYLTGLVAKTTLLGNFRTFTKTVFYITVEVLYQTS